MTGQSEAVVKDVGPEELRQTPTLDVRTHGDAMVMQLELGESGAEAAVSAWTGREGQGTEREIVSAKGDDLDVLAVQRADTEAYPTITNASRTERWFIAPGAR
jgi:hypothetical protein